MDLDDRVVDVDQHPPTGTTGATGLRDQRGLGGQPSQEPGRHGIELTDMAEGERPQERTQR